MLGLEDVSCFLVDEADHFIEYNFIKLHKDGSLGGLLSLQPHRVFMFSATLPLDKEQLITEGPAITVAVHVKYAMRAVINDSKDVAEITGAVH